MKSMGWLFGVVSAGAMAISGCAASTEQPADGDGRAESTADDLVAGRVIRISSEFGYGCLTFRGAGARVWSMPCTGAVEQDVIPENVFNWGTSVRLRFRNTSYCIDASGNAVWCSPIPSSAPNWIMFKNPANGPSDTFLLQNHATSRCMTLGPLDANGNLRPYPILTSDPCPPGPLVNNTYAPAIFRWRQR